MSNVLDLTEKALNYFHKNMYAGKEHDNITLMYFDNIFWDVADVLAKSSTYVQPIKGTNVITKLLKVAKKRTEPRRVELLNQWKKYIEEKTNISCISNKFVVYLVSTYNNIEMENEVKIELDLA